MTPLVSVIIPCYNAGSMLNRCLASCFAQTYPNIEIIFVDNNSTDDSVSRAEQWAQGQRIPLKVVRCPEQGIAPARNRGFEFAQGDYIQWLDADDELSPDKIARQVAALESSVDSDIAYCDWEWCFFTNDKLVGRLPFSVRQYDDFLLRILANDWFPPHAYFLRRQAADRLNALGAWRHEAGSIEDRIYYTLAAIIGLKFLYTEGCSVRYNRWSDSQVTAKYDPENRLREHALSFAWLRLHAANQPKSRLSADHRWLLEQDWQSFRAAAQSSDDLSFSERNVFQIIAKRKKSYPPEIWAARVAHAMWLSFMNHPVLGKEGPIKIREMMRQFLSMPTELEAEEAKEAMLYPSSQFPIVSPILMQERLAIHRLLDRLAGKGFLEPISE